MVYYNFVFCKFNFARIMNFHAKQSFFLHKNKY